MSTVMQSNRRQLKHNLQSAIRSLPILTKIPVLGEILSDVRDFDSDPAARLRIFDRERTFYTTLHFYAFAPNKWAGGYWANLFGWQVVRFLWQNLSWRFRSRPAMKTELAKSTVDDLDKIGVRVLKNFFTPAEFAAINAEYERLRPHFHAYTPESRSLVVGACGAGTIDAPGVNSPVVDKILSNHPQIEEIVAAAARRNIRLKPEVTFIEYHCDESTLGKPQSDGQDVLHSDVGYPSFKVFVYLDDTDRTTGAFTFAPKTHLWGWKRLALEYRMSVNYYRRLKARILGIEPLRNIDREALSVIETPMEAPANSLVVFNTMGFHRRGDFTNFKKPYRRAILVNYRHLDSWANILGWKTNNA
jgi:ectoine hydroxylase-related dioxygenase (phytanoyl-CoA dioxygenase family)